MKRFLLLAAALLTSQGPLAQPLTLSYLGQQIVESGRLHAGTTVGGLSGIDYNPLTGRYLAISDDRSTVNPARFYELSLDLSQFRRQALPGSSGVTFHSVTTLLTPAGKAFGANEVDPEGLRIDTQRQRIYWSNEGQRSSAGFQAPTVRSMSFTGEHLGNFEVPAHYLPAGSNSGLDVGDRGVYNNLAFESLTLSRDGRTLWTATENALAQDDRPSSTQAGSKARLLSFDVDTGRAGAEYIIDVSPVALAPATASGFATNGLTDLLAIGDRQFIAIERSFAVGAATPGTGPNGLPTGNTIRLFHVDARQATDVSGMASIKGHAVVAARKELLLDLSELKNDDGSPLALDNIEGLTLGPIMNGLQTLVLVSDNNFSGSQFTQFVALTIQSPVPEPQTLTLCLAGLASLLPLVRRRC